MKKIFLAVALIASISLTSYAQRKNHIDGEWNRSSYSVKELNLSDEQSQKIRSINKEYRTKVLALRSDSTLSKDDKNTKRKSFAEQKQTAINAILTTEQQSKFKEYEQKRFGKQHSTQIAKNRKELAKRQNPYRDLNLTEGQQNQIKELNKAYRDKTKELALKHQTDIGAVLTPEQQAQLKVANKERVGRQGETSSHFPKRSLKNRLDVETVSKLNNLKEDFQKEKMSIEKSRIAPEEQTRRIKELNQKYRRDRQDLIRGAKVVKSEG